MPEMPYVDVHQGQLVLHDESALGMIRAIENHNRNVAKEELLNLFKSQKERISHFQQRCLTLGYGPKDVIIVLIQVDDKHGSSLANSLMPGCNWQEIRDRGEMPLARGLAGYEGIADAISIIDPELSERLKAIQGLAVAVVGYGTADVYPV